MKKSILLFLFIVQVSLYAQEELEYRPFVEEGKVWNYTGNRRIASPEYQAEWYETYSLEGDTLIGNWHCLKLYLTSNSPYGFLDHSYLGAMYEEGENVYYIASGSNESTLLYDFSCEPEAIVKVNNFELLINEKKLVKYRDKYLKIIGWSPIEDEGTLYHGIWIEGIGSPLDLMNDTPIWFDGCPYKELVTCKLNDQIIYDKDEFEASAQYVTEEPHQPQSFLEGNPIWVYKYEHIPTPRPDGWMKYWLDTGDRTFTYYFLGGQEEIGGKVYTMLGAINSNDENELNVNHWYPIREDGGIVYTITDSLPGVVEYYYYYEDYPVPYLQQGNECILYNFSAEIGDKLDKNNVVKSFDTYQLMDGTECRVLKTGTHYDLYEKLGYKDDDGTYSIIDPLLSIPIATNGHAYVNYLNAFYQDNNMLYKAPDAREGLCVNDTITTLDDAYEYARSYKADPRQEEVFAYIRQLQKEKDPVTFTSGQMATIILPTTPDASKGKYYRLDRYEDGQIIFEQELQPQAHIPYIIVPNEDFSIDLSALDLAGLSRDTVSIAGISFIGSYVSETFDYPDGFYIDFIDITPDCRFDEFCVIGALRAYLLVRWDDPYNQGGTRVPPLNKRGIVLRDYETGITSSLEETGKGAVIYNLAGQRMSNPQKGIYIENGQIILIK